ncbi:MAG: sigma-54 dependent transcriptional regulator [bacterium]|nr:sigma-54 dependent transcriptional regulator [bacterium]
MRILLADDDHSVRRVFQFKMVKRGHDVTTAEDGQQALDRLAEGTFDLMVSDIRMPNVDGIELLAKARTVQPDLKVILITAHATVAQAVEAVKLGAFDYLTKPFNDDELFAVIDKVVAFRRLEEENQLLRGRLQESESRMQLMGVSKPFKEMMRMVERIATTDATVLLTGDSGTGKELVARAIHTRSHRANGPFVAINSGAIPRDLVESELFGHTKGAFTGATREKKGKFELADRGTILLDEVGELAIDLQVKLLRVLQERTVEPVGSERTRAVDVRVIAATNVDLQAQVSRGLFRDDLFYRLNVIPIRVPSLAERQDDISVLARAFVERSGKGTTVSIDRALMERLVAYEWPGNIRELENLIERMVLLRNDDVLGVRDLPADFGSGNVGRPEPESARGAHPTFQEAEESLIRDALGRNGWNQSRAARSLDIPRHVLLYRMKKYGIDPSA